jgi:bacterioferritin
LQVLNPLRIGQNVKEVLEADLAAEHEARDLYEAAAAHCQSVGDRVSKNLFEELMEDEEAHIDFLETQLELIKQVGIELYAQQQIGDLGDDKD